MLQRRFTWNKSVMALLVCICLCVCVAMPTHTYTVGVSIKILICHFTICTGFRYKTVDLNDSYMVGRPHYEDHYHTGNRKIKCLTKDKRISFIIGAYNHSTYCHKHTCLLTRFYDCLCGTLTSELIANHLPLFLGPSTKSNSFTNILLCQLSTSMSTIRIATRTPFGVVPRKIY